MAETIKIGGELESVATGGIVTRAHRILDTTKNKTQEQVNQETDETLAAHSSAISGFEGGNFVTLVATDADADIAAVFTRLDVTPAVNTIYRIANWKHDATTKYNTAYYSEYAANGTTTADLVPISVENKGIDNEPTVGSNNLVKSGGVQNELALGAVYDVSAKNPTAGSNNDGKWESLSALLSDANLNTLIPTGVRKGGMSIKFVCSSDNKYMQYRYMGTATTGSPNPFLDTANWEKYNNVSVSQNTNTGNTYLIIGNDNVAELAGGNKLIKLKSIASRASVSGITGTGQIYYSITLKKLRICTSWTGSADNSTYDDVPFYEGAIYTCDNMLYIWNGTDLVPVSRIQAERSDNVWNGTVLKNSYISSNGTLGTTSGWSCTDYIPITAGQSYYITAKTIKRSTGIAWFDSSKQPISGGGTTIYNTVQTAPEGAAYLVFNLESNNSGLSEDVMVAEGISSKTYEPPYVISISSVKGLTDSFTPIARTIITEQDIATINKKLAGIRLTKSYNLFDELTMTIPNQYISSNGSIGSASGWARTDYIPVTAGQSYYITAKTIGRTQGMSWFDSSKQLISGGSTNIYNTVQTAPSGAAYMVFTLAQNNVYSTEVTVVQGTSGKPFVLPYFISKLAVDGLQEEIDEVYDYVDEQIELLNDGGITFTIDNREYSCVSSKGHINMGRSYSQNIMLNFRNTTFGDFSLNNSDDVAPAHILNTTIGANHGLPCAKVNIASHGFDNTIIGTEWSHSNGKKYYPAQIIDANNILFISQNDGTESSPSFDVMPTGTLTYSGQSYTISTVNQQQLYPSISDYAIQINLDGKVISANGQYKGKLLQLIESYEIINPASVLVNLIARAGQSAAPSFEGAHIARVENIYQIDADLNVIVIANFIALDTIALTNIMFSQAQNITGTPAYYVPNSLPFGSVDLRTPQIVSWSSSIPYIYTDISHTKDTTKPINRVLQYRTNMGFAIGYVPKGVGENLNDFTTQTFEIRNNTGKVYPHGVNATKVGNTLSAGDMFTAILYRCLFNYSAEGNRQSMYHFNLNGTEYVFVDYRASMTDKVNLSKSELNGKSITALESQNTELLTSVYNNGFYVGASYITNETCYIVCKIE